VAEQHETVDRPDGAPRRTRFRRRGGMLAVGLLAAAAIIVGGAVTAHADEPGTTPQPSQTVKITFWNHTSAIISAYDFWWDGGSVGTGSFGSGGLVGENKKTIEVPLDKPGLRSQLSMLTNPASGSWDHYGETVGPRIDTQHPIELKPGTEVCVNIYGSLEPIPGGGLSFYSNPEIETC
jgi:hypothetical protein